MNQKRRLTKQSARLQKKDKIHSCSDCAHAMLDPLFGDYKCLQREYYVYDMTIANHCETYKNDEKDDIDS